MSAPTVRCCSSPASPRRSAASTRSPTWSLEVPEGKIVGVIGPNGAGKTTTVQRHHRRLSRRCRRGAARRRRRSPHGRRIGSCARASRAPSRTSACSPSMTVWEHLLVAQPHSECRWRRLLPTRWANPAALAPRRGGDGVLRPHRTVRDRPARSLPYGIQRKVEMARAVTARPKLLLLDEPVAGMNHDEADEIRQLMLQLRDTGLSILLIEHDMNFVMRLCDYLYVLDFGVLIARASPRRSAPTRSCSTPISERTRDARDPRSAGPLRRHHRRARHRSRHQAGEIVALLGANGAGKTTIARAIAGLLPYPGRDRLSRATTLKPNSAERNLRRGIALVPEGRGILARMTVDENLLMGIYTRTDKAQAMADVAQDAGAVSRSSPSAATTWPACSAAANSRCWPSAARCCRSRNCCCSTSRRSASRRR